MAKAEMDMIRDILGWPASDEQKLALIRQIAAKPAVKPSPVAAKPKASAQPPAKVMKRKRSALRGEGAAYTRRSMLWTELKRLAPEKMAGLRYTKVSTEQLEPLVAEARKAKGV